ncbi:Calcium-binding EF-hand [Quillaja saponaria]|uniref:Calcium-binding EF-hand n=1 Tax=Quillaja saponaria TaxID=32244 RepID=A0AAD7VK51_QUISA|nr:Calcium-binding EF-hand [Quillaja saponaria]
MAAGLKRDPIVILRIDGEDLLEFINGPSYEAEMVPIFSHIEPPNGSLRDYIIEALGKLTVDQGMPPSDSWETLLAEFKKVAEYVAQHLKEQPVIVAHSENTFDGSGIKRLLSNKFELDKSLNSVLENVPKDRNGKVPKEHLRVALDSVAASAGLPPYGAINEMDNIVGEAFNVMNADDGKMVKEDDFKKTLTEILDSVMLQLEGNPISVSTSSVVHEPLGSSTLIHPSSSETEEQPLSI